MSNDNFMFDADERDALTARAEAAEARSAALERENNVLRGLLATSPLPCQYCGLEDMLRCALGFPGCHRADDLLLGQTEAERHHAEKDPNVE